MKKHFPVIALVLSLFCFAGTLVRPFIVQDYAKIVGFDGASVFVYKTDTTAENTTTNAIVELMADGSFSISQADGTLSAGFSVPDGILTSQAIHCTTFESVADITTTGGNFVAPVGGVTAGGSAGVASAGPVVINVSGYGLKLKEGADSVAGATNLTGGSVVIPTASVTANSWIFLTRKEGGVLANVGNIGVTARTAGTSFTVTSLNVLDTEYFVWMIVEPSP